MSQSTLSLRPVAAASGRDVRCPTCRKLIFDGKVLLARVTRFWPESTEACCKVCKTWVKVPVVILAKAPPACSAEKSTSERS